MRTASSCSITETGEFRDVADVVFGDHGAFLLLRAAENGTAILLQPQRPYKKGGPPAETVCRTPAHLKAS